MKRRLLSICLMCILVLSGCGKGETEEQDIQIPAEPENTKYKMEELILPDFFSAQEEEHEFEYEEERTPYLMDLSVTSRGNQRYMPAVLH